MPYLVFLLFLLFLILLWAYFTWDSLIFKIKSGDLKTVKSKIAGVIVWIVICVGLPALFFVWWSLPRSGNQLFKDFILTPMPKSVDVLDSYDGDPALNPDYCLHFKIAPADFQQIVASKNWQIVSDAPIGGLQCDYKNPAWAFMFPPPSLGSTVTTYTFIPRERDFEIMFTNPQMNEVYYFYHDGHTH
jgi:hypothetical protein